MSNFKVYVAEESIAALGQDMKDLGSAFEAKAKAALQMAAAQAHGFIVQEVQTKLKSSRDLYLSNLVGPFEQGDNVWVVGLKEGAKFIEEGYDPHSMIHDLTHGPNSKVGKDGKRYNTIPFKHGGNKSSMSQAQTQLSAFVKQELKSHGLDKILRDQNNNVLTGKVATIKSGGSNAPWSRFGKLSLLAGLSVYQTVVKNPTTGKESVRRDIMTFRRVSENQEGSGKWYNKGYAGAHIFDKVSKQVDEAWNQMIGDLLKE